MGRLGCPWADRALLHECRAPQSAISWAVGTAEYRVQSGRLGVCRGRSLPRRPIRPQQVVTSIHLKARLGYIVAYGAWHPKWTWWIGIVVDHVVRFYFVPRDARLNANLRDISNGAHLLVTAFTLPAAGNMHQGIMELSSEEIVFHSVSLFPREIVRWEAGIWKTRTRSPRKGDSLFLRFGWPRTTVIDCERDSVSMTVAATRIDLNLIEALLSNQA